MNRNYLNTALFLGFSISQLFASNNVLSPAETQAGFQLLFDGRSTAHWNIDWKIEDSAMASPNTGAMLYSVADTFSNFEWRIDFKVNKAGNSGFFIHSSNDWYCSGFEVAVLDSKDGGDAGETSNSQNKDTMAAGIFDVHAGQNFSFGSNVPIKRSGAIYDIYPTTKNGVTIPKGGVYVDMMKPAMEWNTMIIWANGNNIETWLNGMKVTDFVIGSDDFNTRYHRSKFPNSSPYCGDSYAKSPSGKLVVQDHGGGLLVWIRNIKLRSFTPGSKLPIPVITPNGGNVSTNSKITLDAGVIGAQIRYTLDGSEPSDTSPLYNDSALILTKSATVKTRAYRNTFIASDVTTANFTLSGTKTINPKNPLELKIKIHSEQKSFTIENPNASLLKVDLMKPNGEVIESQSTSKHYLVLAYPKLQTGLYLIQVHSQNQTQIQKIFIQ